MEAFVDFLLTIVLPLGAILAVAVLIRFTLGNNPFIGSGCGGG